MRQIQKMKKIIIGIFLSISALPAMAITVSGAVVDSESSEPLAGATILETGTNNYTIADANGAFTLDKVNDSSTLTIQYVTYKDKTIKAESTVGTIKLESDTILDEVVVTTSNIGKPCGQSVLPANATAGTWQKDSNDKTICVVSECATGYMPNDNGTACEVSEGPCKPDQVKAIEHATKGELKKGVCHATECESGYEPAGGKCTAIGGKCSNMPKNAKTAHREYDTAAGAEVCIVDACDDGCRISADKKSCNCPKLSEEDSQKKIDELKDNAQAMKDKEQSLTARLTSGAAIGGMGIGGMQALSAVAEQKADADAEQDMAAYLATFRCDFGQGRNIKGGEKQIELPGANSLFQLNQEYKSLAADLKARKESLEMRAGIEAEHIDDKATTGLYDDVSLGRTDGAFTSIARALSDEASDDAAEWAAQKADTKKKLKTGAIVAGVGAAVGIAGNIAVAATGPKNQTNAINAKYEALKKLQSDVAKLPNAETGAKCPSNATGTYPNCTCSDTGMVYATVSNTCEACPAGETAQNGNCVAVVAAGVTPQCDATDPNMQVDAKTGNCTCQNDWLETKDKKNCECPSETHVVVENKCVKKQTGILDNLGDVASKLAGDQNITLPSIELPGRQQPEKIELSSKQLFALGSANLTAEAKNTLNTFATEVKSKTEGNENYCISVTGHTDRTGSQKRNQQLSHQRAKAVKDQLVTAGLPAANFTTGGRASSECKSDGPQESCRKVEIELSATKCPA